MVRKSRQVRRTLLVVGEGDCEQAFLKHLRALYCSGNDGVNATIANAHGKGPEHVVDYTVRRARPFSHDQCVALLDTDLPWSDKLKKLARKEKIMMIGSAPCLEGLLLNILGFRQPEKSDDCKILIHQKFGLDFTEANSYSVQFGKEILESARLRIPELDRLIKFFEGL